MTKAFPKAGFFAPRQPNRIISRRQIRVTVSRYAFVLLYYCFENTNTVKQFSFYGINSKTSLLRAPVGQNLRP